MPARKTRTKHGGARLGAGRPTGTAVATAHLHVRISPAELAQVERAALAAGLSTSEYVRKALAQASEKTAKSGESQKSTSAA